MQHQTHTTTEHDRYPDIFAFLSHFKSFQNILSFGCSSGEECFSLKQYFPSSNIFGVDINQEALRQAIGKNKHDSIVFSNSIDNVPQVDAIFAMSIFCRWPETSQLEQNNVYSFLDFDSEVSRLDNKLNQGGAFVVYNSNYFFSDTECSEKYVGLNISLREEFVRKFDKTGKRSTDSSPIIFIKCK